MGYSTKTSVYKTIQEMFNAKFSSTPLEGDDLFICCGSRCLHAEEVRLDQSSEYRTIEKKIRRGDRSLHKNYVEGRSLFNELAPLSNFQLSTIDELPALRDELVRVSTNFCHNVEMEKYCISTSYKVYCLLAPGHPDSNRYAAPDLHELLVSLRKPDIPMDDRRFCPVTEEYRKVYQKLIFRTTFNPHTIGLSFPCLDDYFSTGKPRKFIIREERQKFIEAIITGDYWLNLHRTNAQKVSDAINSMDMGRRCSTDDGLLPRLFSTDLKPFDDWIFASLMFQNSTIYCHLGIELRLVSAIESILESRIELKEGNAGTSSMHS